MTGEVSFGGERARLLIRPRNPERRVTRRAPAVLGGSFTPPRDIESAVLSTVRDGHRLVVVPGGYHQDGVLVSPRVARAVRSCLLKGWLLPDLSLSPMGLTVMEYVYADADKR